MSPRFAVALVLGVQTAISLLDGCASDGHPAYSDQSGNEPVLGRAEGTPTPGGGGSASGGGGGATEITDATTDAATGTFDGNGTDFDANLPDVGASTFDG